jgi:hypothetical protein
MRLIAEVNEWPRLGGGKLTSSARHWAKLESAVWASSSQCQGDVPVRESALDIAVVRADRRGSLERSRNTGARRSDVRALNRRIESDEHERAKHRQRQVHISLLTEWRKPSSRSTTLHSAVHDRAHFC